MGDFVVNAAIVHQVGAARGHLSILSAMDISLDELLADFGGTINDLILSHRPDLEKTRAAIPSLPEFMRRSLPGPKMRWVDGTPEYSLYIYALRKLFPEAVFIHVLRDVRDVVRSMLNLHRLAGVHLVASEEEAYRYLAAYCQGMRAGRTGLRFERRSPPSLQCFDRPPGVCDSLHSGLCGRVV